MFEKGKHVYHPFPFSWFPSEWEAIDSGFITGEEFEFPFSWFPSEWEGRFWEYGLCYISVSIQLVSQRVGRMFNITDGLGLTTTFPFSWFPSEWEGGIPSALRKVLDGFHSVGFPASGKGRGLKP